MAIMKIDGMPSNKWQEIANASTNESVLLLFAWLADTIQVREMGGNNRGVWVERFLKSCGLPGGNPWCAASIYWASLAVGAPTPKSGGASVSSWRDWAKATGRHRSKAKRGYCCYKKSGGVSHIGMVVRSFGGFTYSIEGNTSQGNAGSQQDGGGLYRRVRRASFWDGFISQDPAG